MKFHHIIWALTNKYNYIVNPPLREKGDIDFLIKAIKEGYVDAIATDSMLPTVKKIKQRAHQEFLD